MADQSNGSATRRSSRKTMASKRYDDCIYDKQLDLHLPSSPKKLLKTKEEIQKESETEAMLAASLGFPTCKLRQDEIQAGVVSELGGSDENDYTVVRNHILARWRGDVNRWLSKGDISERVDKGSGRFVVAAYDFLFINGYINFGAIPTFVPRVLEAPKKAGTVVIVGAGLSGLAAARQLMSFGFKVLIVEGRIRAGGRVFTQSIGQKDKLASVDLGGSVIMGTHANPLVVMARQLSLPLHKIRNQCPLYKPDGTPVDEDLDTKMEFRFNMLLDKATELRKYMGGFANDISLGSVLQKLEQLFFDGRTPEEKQLLDWHLANLEYCNAGSLSDLSVAHWDQDDIYEMGGDHCFLAGGNGSLIKALCEGVPILYGTTVNTIRYNNKGVEVLTDNQVFCADYVLCTVPLGVLKKRAIKFEPELPARKLEAIGRLGFGLLDKVAMVFPHVFWDDLDTFGCLREQSHQRGEYFMFISYHTVSGGPVLIALVAGQAAEAFEQTDPLILVQGVMNILRGIYNPKGINVPDPIQSICTRWGSDPFSYGSYSHLKVGSSGADYDIIAENVDNRLFFAGEGTTRMYPATMHGAFLSGLREASCIFRAGRGVQNPSEECSQKQLGVTLRILEDLFKRPDLEFGNFFCVFDPLDPDPKSTGILRITLWGAEDIRRKESAKSVGRFLTLPMQLYALLSREQAGQLDHVGRRDGVGNRSRMKFLTNFLGIQVMGADVFGAHESSFIANLARARRGHKGRKRLAMPAS